MLNQLSKENNKIDGNEINYIATNYADIFINIKNETISIIIEQDISIRKMQDVLDGLYGMVRNLRDLYHVD